jgi:hypothetical protein
MKTISTLVIASLGLGLAACGSAPTPAGEDDDSATSELRASDSAAQRPGGGTCSPPSPRKQRNACLSIDPGCTVSPSSSLSPEDEATRVALCCAPPLYYLNGGNAWMLGGIVSLCPDTQAVRNRFALAHPEGFCDACLPPSPPGTRYVYWMAFVGPTCGSGCIRGSQPDPY